MKPLLSVSHYRKWAIHNPPPTSLSIIHGTQTHPRNNDSEKSKAMDMRFHWIKCREAQGHLRYLWRQIKTNVLNITPIITHPNIIETCAQNTCHSTLHMIVSGTVGSTKSYDYGIIHYGNESARVCCSHPSCDRYSIEYQSFSHDSEH